MKRLHEVIEERWQFKALGIMDGVVKRGPSPTQFILLLHGLGERGRRMYRKLLPYLPANSIILAPNGPFPIPRIQDHKIDYGYTWYFYDRFEKKYLINQDLAKSWLKEIVALNNPDNLPVTIIGFSQGGYLAPMVGQEVSGTKLVIGIGCEFRHHLLEGAVNFPMEAIHGMKDETISSQSAFNEIELLKKHKNISSGWHLIENTGHEISNGVGMKVKELMEAYGKRSL